MLSRILPQLRVPYRILPSPLGFVPRPSTTFRCLVEYDIGKRLLVYGSVGHRCNSGLLLPLVLLDPGYLVCDGGHKRYVAQSKVTLG